MRKGGGWGRVADKWITRYVRTEIQECRIKKGTYWRDEGVDKGI